MARRRRQTYGHGRRLEAEGGVALAPRLGDEAVDADDGRHGEVGVHEADEEGAVDGGDVDACVVVDLGLGDHQVFVGLGDVRDLAASKVPRLESQSSRLLNTNNIHLKIWSHWPGSGGCS